MIFSIIKENRRFFMQKKSLIIVLICQFLILAIACGSYLLNRGKAFYQVYSPQDFTLSAGEYRETDGIVIEDNHGHTGSFLSFTEALDKGIYLIRINYTTNSAGNTISASCSEISDLDIRTAPAKLEPGVSTAYITLDLRRDAREVLVDVSFNGEGYLTVSEISIHETSNVYKQNLFRAFCLCILLALLYGFYLADKEKRGTMLGLTVIWLFSCYPLQSIYMNGGHDLAFHLLRIEGIYHGLMQGTFPVKIHPMWAKDYGYAVGVFYGDAALYIPAFLRLIGFSVQSAYTYFTAFMNLATVLISYFCLKGIFSNKKAGIVGSALYTFSLYRLADVYTRASVGEYTALTFLPLVLYGFYLIFTETDAKKHWFKNAAIVSLGLTGVIQSHTLSCIMIVVFVALLCLILIKKVIRPHTFLMLAAGAGFTLLMNLGFLIPFLDFYDESIYINSPEWGTQTVYSIQNLGMYPTQLFGLMHPVVGGNWITSVGVSNETAYSLGLVITLCIVLFLYIALCCRSKEENDPLFKPSLLCCALGMLALFMSTCYFPWDTLATLGSLPETLISSLQFPWRFLTVATPLLIVPSCYAILRVEKYLSATKTTVILGTLASLFIVSSGWYFYSFVFCGTPYNVYDTYELNSMTMYSNEYLPTGTNPEEITAGLVNSSEGVAYDSYTKDGTHITCNVSTQTESSIEFPLNYYKYYQCRDVNTGQKFTVEPGYNNMVKVNFPAGYNGSVEVSFQEPVLWRICEVISFLTIFVVLILIVYFPLKKALHKLCKRLFDSFSYSLSYTSNSKSA